MPRAHRNAYGRAHAKRIREVEGTFFFPCAIDLGPEKHKGHQLRGRSTKSSSSAYFARKGTRRLELAVGSTRAESGSQSGLSRNSCSRLR